MASPPTTPHVLIGSADTAAYYEAVVAAGADAKAASNWVMGEVMRELNERRIDIGAFAITPTHLAEVVTLQASGKINSTTAKEVFQEMIVGGKSAPVLVKEKGLEQISDDSAIEKEAIAVLDDNPEEVKRYLAGKEQLLQFFVGQLMKRTRGTANPKVAAEIVKALLAQRR